MIQSGANVIASAPDYDADTVAELEDMGVRYEQLSFERTGRNPFGDLIYCFRLMAFFKREAPDQVFAYTVKAVLYGCLAARFTTVPKVHALISGVGYLFSDGASRKKSALLRVLLPVYRFALRRVAVIFFQNPDDVATYQSFGLIAPESEIVQVNGSGVDLAAFSPNAIPMEPIRFCLIARLIRDKGLYEYAEAARLLKARYGSAVECILVGPTDTNPGAIPAADLFEWQQSGVIDYRGELRDVRTVLGESSVYVLPSYYMEGVPRTILEAMAMGRPIVTCDSRGCRETVEAGVNGYLVPPRDSASLFEAMALFVSSLK